MRQLRTSWLVGTSQSRIYFVFRLNETERILEEQMTGAKMQIFIQLFIGIIVHEIRKLNDEKFWRILMTNISLRFLFLCFQYVYLIFMKRD